MTKFSGIPPNSSPALGDYLVGVTAGNVDDRVTMANLITLFFANVPAGSIKAPAIGTDASFAWTAFAPAVTASTGAFTTASGAGRYFQIGKLVIYSVACTITTIGTGTGCQFALPVTAISGVGVIGSAREDATSGNAGMCKLATNTLATVSRYDNGNIVSGGSGSVVRVFGAYEAA